MRAADVCRRGLAGAILAGVVASTPAGAQPAVRKAAAAVVPGSELSASLEAAAKAVSPSVVEIFTTTYVANEGAPPHRTDLVMTQRASGSGVIVDPSGLIVTNAHVVQGAQRLRVEIPALAGGRSILATGPRSVTGEVIGLDLETDLAVVKVDAGRLPALPLGDSDALRTGQLVLAFGSPLGLQNTVSLGVVSSVARQLEPDSPMIYVQTDAAIHTGSSGGPLVDLTGRVVGINTLMVSRSGGYEGVGFAAPANIVRTVYEQIRIHGRVRRGDIGVRAQTITPELAAGLGLARDRGVVLADVLPRSPAAVAGLAPGDVVLALDGKPMENSRQLQVGLYRHVVGDIVTLEILRAGRPSTFPVAMTERLDALSDPAAAGDPRRHLVPRLGILAVPLDPRVAEMLPPVRGGRGVVVISTVSGAIESRHGGLAPGDVIYSVNRNPVGELTALRTAVDAVVPGQPIVLHLERNGELIFVTFLAE
jgi:serine protease Do